MIPFVSQGAATWADALLLGILAFAVRATVLLAGAWLATWLLRRGSAATRHLIWSGAIAGVLALPLLGVTMPAWNVPVIPIAASADAPLAPADAAPATGSGAAVTNTLPSSAATPMVRSQRESTALPADAQQGVTSSLASLTDAVSAQVLFATAWLLVTVLLLLRLAIANARVSAWQRSSQPVEDARTLALLRRLCRQYRIERPVVLLESEETDVPVTWGVVYPVILLPASATAWEEEQHIAVLTHELAHVKRFDALTQLLAQMALALLWFHPLAWLAVRRMRLEREHACDDFVLVTGARPSRYADDILNLARRLVRPTAPAAAALAMARKSELEGRLLAILDPATRRGSVQRARVAVLALAVLLFAMPLAAFRPAARVRVQPSALAVRTDSAALKASVSAPIRHDSEPTVVVTQLQPKAPSGRIDATDVLASLTGRLGVKPQAALASPLRMPDLLRIRPDTDPAHYIDLATLIDVTKAAKRMTSDSEKGQLLALIAKRYQRSDDLRDAYLDAVFTMTSDHERSQALIALLDRDSLPLSAVAKVLRSTAAMTSDMNKGQVLKRISPAVFADTAVQRAYLYAIVAMTSDIERSGAISGLMKQRGLAPGLQVALLQAVAPMISSVEKANSLMTFLNYQGIADERVRRAFFKTAETLTSDSDYRRVMAAVMK